MGRIRGNPPALMMLFFSFAVFLTGSLYATWGTAVDGNVLTLMIAAVQVSALAFVFLVLGRILWVMAGLRVQGQPAADSEAEKGGPPLPRS